MPSTYSVREGGGALPLPPVKGGRGTEPVSACCSEIKSRSGTKEEESHQKVTGREPLPDLVPWDKASVRPSPTPGGGGYQGDWRGRVGNTEGGRPREVFHVVN